MCSEKENIYHLLHDLIVPPCLATLTSLLFLHPFIERKNIPHYLCIHSKFPYQTFSGGGRRSLGVVGELEEGGWSTERYNFASWDYYKNPYCRHLHQWILCRPALPANSWELHLHKLRKNKLMILLYWQWKWIDMDGCGGWWGKHIAHKGHSLTHFFGQYTTEAAPHWPPHSITRNSNDTWCNEYLTK